LSAGRAASSDGVLELHRRLRQRDVKVGQHVAVSPGSLPRFLARFAEVYGGLGRLDSLVSVAAAHHRLLWMHPFLDGNGRVARLMSHANYPRRRDGFSKRCCTEGRCRAGTWRLLPAQGTGRGAAFRRPWSTKACWARKALVRRRIWHFPRASRTDGCQACFPSGPTELNNTEQQRRAATNDVVNADPHRTVAPPGQPPDSA